MISLYQIVSLLLLAPFFFGVFFFCPFKIPYLYCLICPVRCLWYRARGIVLLIALGLNIKGGLFCKQICPFGTVQVLLSRISPKKIVFPHNLRRFKYISLIIVILVVAATKIPQLLFIVRLKHLLWGVFLLGMALSIFSYCFFCHNLCPVKALNVMLDKGRRKWEPPAG